MIYFAVALGSSFVVVGRAFTTKPAVLHHTSGAIWDSYLETLTAIVDSPRVKKKKKLNEKPVVDYLTDPQTNFDPPPLENRQDMPQILADHRRDFAERFKLDSEQMDYLLRCLAYMGDHCAKAQKVLPAMVAWSKLRETGIQPRERLVSTYLYVLSSGSDPPVDTVVEAATFHDLLFAPNEKTAYLRIKFLVLQGQPDAARNVLFQSNQDWQKLRTFLPLLEHYLLSGDLNQALNLFLDMRAAPGAILDADTYAMLLSQLAVRGRFSETVPAISDEWSNEGSKLLDQILDAMSKDLLELTPEAVDSVYRSFCQGFNNAITDECCSINDEIVVGRVKVDETSAVCTTTGARLRLFDLTQQQRGQVHERLLDMATLQHEEFSAKLQARGISTGNRVDSQSAEENLRTFSNWLKNQTAPYNVIVDGANVAYADHGDLHYSQILHVVERLEAMGERPLVVMPSKYVGKKFYVAGIGKNQVLSDREYQVVEDLISSNKMYQVPAACLDDYYWMIASVADPRAAEVVQAENPTGRFPGLRPMLVTNDQMRDHKLALLEPRLFRRWKGSHIVKYKIQPYQENEWETRQVDFAPADFFSREIQVNEASGPMSGRAWHIPVTTWDHNERLCINIQGCSS